MLLQRPDPVVADHADDVDAMPCEGVELHARRSRRAVAEQQHDLALGVGELRRERVAGAGAEAPERPGVQPAAGEVAVDHAPRVGDVVAAVADRRSRRGRGPRASSAYRAHRVQRRAVVAQLGPARA